MNSVHFLIPNTPQCLAYLYRWADVVGELTMPESGTVHWADHEIYSKIPTWAHVVVRNHDLDQCISDARYQMDRIRSGMDPIYEGYVYNNDGQRASNTADALEGVWS